MAMSTVQHYLIEYGTPEYDATLDLRYRVLREPLGLYFTVAQIEDEWSSTHFASFEQDGAIIACLILKPVSESVWKMRQVAVEPAWQGRGIGRELVKCAETFVQRKVNESRMSHTIELHARRGAVAFYEQLDYEIHGAIFLEIGIEHQAMKKQLHYEKN